MSCYTQAYWPLPLDSATSTVKTCFSHVYSLEKVQCLKLTVCKQNICFTVFMYICIYSNVKDHSE